MKRAGVVAAGIALAASTAIATPSFGAKHADPCAILRSQLNTLEVRLARQGIDTRAGSRTLAKIFTLRETARFIHCSL
jgi:hypothetical protein